MSKTKGKIIAKCDFCNKEYNCFPCESKRKYCSVLCTSRAPERLRKYKISEKCRQASIAARTKLPRVFVCPTCKQEFSNRYGKISKYCSRDCRYKSQVGKEPHNKNKPTSENAKGKQSIARKKFYDSGGIPWNKGMLNEYKQSAETAKKISARLQNIPLEEWRGNITPQKIALRMSQEYKKWRLSVFTRDNFTCVWCGRKRIKGDRVFLEADHIKPFAYFPELRFALNNGRTLCRECHKRTDTYGYKSKKYDPTRTNKIMD